MRLSAAVLWPLALAGGIQAAELDCASCHDEQAQMFAGSVHGGLSCTACHGNVKTVPHEGNAKEVRCVTCHADSESGVASSVHAKVAQQPCTVCHGDAHAILPSKDPRSRTFAMNLPRTCGACHDGETAKKDHRPEVYNHYLDSIHGMALTKDGLLVAASCTSCHGAHGILAATNPKSRVFPSNVPATCGTCHEVPLRDYSQSVHEQALLQGNKNAPVCTSCHTAHQITRVTAAAWQIQTAATCGRCHEKQLTTYRDTLHSQVSSLGYVDVAHCWDCHASHRILPASNPASSIAQANLTKTCGQCHQGANAGLTGYQPHADWRDAKRFPLLHYSNVFMIFLLVSVLGFFTLHTALWLIRSSFDSTGRRKGA